LVLCVVLVFHFGLFLLFLLMLYRLLMADGWGLKLGG